MTDRAFGPMMNLDFFESEDGFMAKNICYSYVPDHGWTGKGFSIEHAPVDAAEVSIECGRRPVWLYVPCV